MPQAYDSRTRLKVNPGESSGVPDCSLTVREVEIATHVSTHVSTVKSKTVDTAVCDGKNQAVQEWGLHECTRRAAVPASLALQVFLNMYTATSLWKWADK